MKEVPDTSKWLPRKDASTTLKDIFYKRCMDIEELILNKVQQEKRFNIDNFDSGLGVEEIIREEFSKILPERYLVTRGIVNDRNGLTSGDHDLIIFNNFWFPYLKPGVTNGSRRSYFPIEGIYSIGEIKQTLTTESLDKAMEKLVKCKRLERPKTGRTRIVENRELDACAHEYTNPLYSFILATQLDESLSIDDVFIRFFEINKQLKRSELVNSLCILQKGTILWSFFDEENNNVTPAMFHSIKKGLNKPILPVLLGIDEVRKSSLYDLIMHLLANLYDTILGAEDLAVAYGNDYNEIKTPPKDKFLINPK
jgi:hypothetical protein